MRLALSLNSDTDVKQTLMHISNLSYGNQNAEAELRTSIVGSSLQGLTYISKGGGILGVRQARCHLCLRGFLTCFWNGPYSFSRRDTYPNGKHHAQRKFREKYNLPYPLLADVDEIVCNQFGVLKEKNMYGKKVIGIERTTFVIDTDRTVLDVIASEVSMDTHADKALEVLRERQSA